MGKTKGKKRQLPSIDQEIEKKSAEWSEQFLGSR